MHLSLHISLRVPALDSESWRNIRSSATKVRSSPLLERIVG
jgi:hypothetical protein